MSWFDNAEHDKNSKAIPEDAFSTRVLCITSTRLSIYFSSVGDVSFDE